MYILYSDHVISCYWLCSLTSFYHASTPSPIQLSIKPQINIKYYLFHPMHPYFLHQYLHSVNIHPFIYLSIHSSFQPSVFPSTNHSVQCVHPSYHIHLLSIHFPYICISIPPPAIYPSIYISIIQSLHPSLHSSTKHQMGSLVQKYIT